MERAIFLGLGSERDWRGSGFLGAFYIDYPHIFGKLGQPYASFKPKAPGLDGDRGAFLIDAARQQANICLKIGRRPTISQRDL